MNVLLILGIDTSGKTAAAALCSDNALQAQKSVYTRFTHSQVILPMVRELLSDCGATLQEIDRFAVTVGPGSYTGLRIGISAVRAMAYALDKPCAAVSTLESLAWSCLPFDGLICPIMKARGELVYSGLFKSDSVRLLREKKDKLTSQKDLYIEIAQCGKIMLTGDGAEDFFKEFSPKNTVLSPVTMRMQNAASLCLAAAYAEPVSYDMLSADYFEITKAEKELLQKNKKN